jgi:hypothetical protein
MSKYVRKTEDEFQIWQNLYGTWEEVSCCSTRKDALREVKEYRENQPEFAVKIKKVRVKK